MNFFILYGILKHLNQNNVYSSDNIDSIYATSCGTVLGTILILNLEWKTLDNYLINRPWHNVFNINPEALFNCIENKGVITIDYLNTFFDPLFKAKDFNINITLKEFFDKTNIKFNLYTTTYPQLNLVCLNYINFPDLSLIKAIYMSCS